MRSSNVTGNELVSTLQLLSQSSYLGSQAKRNSMYFFHFGITNNKKSGLVTTSCLQIKLRKRNILGFLVVIVTGPGSNTNLQIKDCKVLQSPLEISSQEVYSSLLHFSFNQKCKYLGSHRTSSTTILLVVEKNEASDILREISTL